MFCIIIVSDVNCFKTNAHFIITDCAIYATALALLYIFKLSGSPSE